MEILHNSPQIRHQSVSRRGGLRDILWGLSPKNMPDTTTGENLSAYRHTDRQTDRETDRQTHWQTDTLTHWQTDRQSSTCLVRASSQWQSLYTCWRQWREPVCRQTDRQTDRHRETDRDRQRQTDRQRVRVPVRWEPAVNDSLFTRVDDNER